MMQCYFKIQIWPPAPQSSQIQYYFQIISATLQ